MSYLENKKKKERAILVGVQLKDIDNDTFSESISELKSLAKTADINVKSIITQKRRSPDRRYFVGKGKLEEIRTELLEAEGDVVIFDEHLSPGQVRNVEESLDVKVIDRGNLILDIFALHAKTNEARIQVELAQLQYLLPRLTRMWSHFSKHAGGIGTRGPGETQLEIDRRGVGKKIARLKKQLEKINKQKITQRKQRQQIYKIALVGYTNAGKSTLFNYLTKSGVWVENRLFCTLDAVTRYIPLSNGKRIVISDTVGFIRKLPHELVASFASTLAEVKLADLLLQVIDISHANALDHYYKTNEVLNEIGASNVPKLLVLNKCDLLADNEVPLLDPSINPAHIFQISALSGNGIDILLKFLTKYVDNNNENY